MKLHEIKRVRPTNSETLTVEPAGGIYGEFDVVVEFDYQGPSFTQHEPDDASFREYHEAEIDIESIKTTEEVFEFDSDGEKTGKSWPEGTNVSELPGWGKDDDENVINKLHDKAEESDDEDNGAADSYYDY